MSRATEAELEVLSSLLDAVEGSEWTASVEGRDHVAGSDIIMVSDGDIRYEDIEVTRENRRASAAELDLISMAVTLLPRILAEVQECRASRPADCAG